MNEVANFLRANALYWLDEYHIDGLRVDAVASMLYLDYGRRDGQWVANKYGGNENLEAIEFFKHLNSLIRGRKDGTFIIAEESTAWPKITAAPEDDGLGFTFKWNMGWMHDFLEYMKLDPYFRKFNHNKMTFSISYMTSENYILVLSHDEVVHLKCSMINKMPGIYEDKFANLKAGYAFMLGHPGKKLLFMGQEFAQAREWSEARSLDWYLLENPNNKGIQEYVKALNKLYKDYDALYYNDDESIGFEWTKVDDADSGIVAFIRRGKTAKNQIMFICNFVPVERKEYRIGVPCLTGYTEILSSDDKKFGGLGRNNVMKNGRGKTIKAEAVACDRCENSIVLDVPPLSVTVLKYDYTA